MIHSDHNDDGRIRESSLCVDVLWTSYFVRYTSQFTGHCGSVTAQRVVSQYTGRVAEGPHAAAMAGIGRSLTGNGCPQSATVRPTPGPDLKGAADCAVQVALGKRIRLVRKCNQTHRRDWVNADKRAADYKVAIEKCDALAGPAKGFCVSTAKTQYGKS